MKLIGHEFTKDLLLRFLEREYDSYSFIFEGKECIGKKLLALYTAKGFLCEKKVAFGCNECNSCRLVSQTIEKEYSQNKDISGHPDIKIVKPEGKDIKIGQIREAIEFLKLKSKNGKVIIIDDAEKMNTEAANALLKTLEEPPEKSMIILITSNHNKLLPTIVSRCKKVRFKPLTEEDIKHILSLKGFSNSQIDKVIKVSDGSLCLPLHILENESVYNFAKDIFNLISLLIEKNEIHSEGIISLADILDKQDNDSIFNIISILEILLYKKNMEKNISPDTYEKILKELGKLKLAISKGVKKKLALEGFYFNLVR